MKIYLYILCFILGLSNCCIKSDSINQQTRDTVIYYDTFGSYSTSSTTEAYVDGVALWFNPPISKRLDSDKCFIVYPYSAELQLFDNLSVTVLTAELYSPHSCYGFMKYYINTYCNHYPLDNDDFRKIIKLVTYAYFFVEEYGSYKYDKMHHIVTTNYVNDTLNRRYELSFCDTISDVTTEMELKYHNNGYSLKFSNFPIDQTVEFFRHNHYIL